MNSITKFLLLIVMIFSYTSNGFAQKKDDFRKIENKSFKVGEKLTFDVNYGFITAGVAEYNIPKIMKLAGRDVYQITFGVNTVSTFDALYKVRDRYETYVDVEGLFPWRFEQHIKEGSFTKDYSAFFDHRAGKAKTSDGDYKLPKYTHDIISAFYICRTFDYSKSKKGDIIKLKNFYEGKVHQLDVVFRGRERISVAAGKFDCVILEPLVRKGGLFKNEGSIYVWLTDDDIKMPVKVKTKVVIGSIDAELTKYEGLAGKLTSKR